MGLIVGLSYSGGSAKDRRRANLRGQADVGIDARIVGKGVCACPLHLVLAPAWLAGDAVAAAGNEAAHS